MKKSIIIFSLVFSTLFLSFTANAKLSNKPESHKPLANEPLELDFNYGACSDIDDPLESVNRKIFTFNSVLDHFFLSPIARGYRKAFNDPTRDKIGNALANTKVPLTMVNNVLQAEGDKTLHSFWQFMINSTLGIAGTQDVARSRGLHVEAQTLGSTLAAYGFGPGPYVVLPFFGGSSTRDALDSPFANGIMNPINHQLHPNVRTAISAGTLISDRADFLPFTDHVSKTSPDPYVTIRSAVHQRREGKVHYPAHYRCKTIVRN